MCKFQIILCKNDINNDIDIDIDIDRMDITQYLTQCVKYKIPVSFSKYGDGEYNCATGCWGANCDNDPYTQKLSNALVNSFKYMVNDAHNAHIGLWHDKSKQQQWENFVYKPVRWAKYHTILFDQHNDEEKVKLYREIKQSDSKKIIICNKLLLKSKLLFDAQYMINVPFNNWFDGFFDDILSNIRDIIKNDDKPPIIITCCGMGAKVLICELYKICPNGIFLDFGSGLDFLCTKRDSRGCSHTYDYMKTILGDVIPSNWEDEKYDAIYEEAKSKMGVHL